MRFCHALTFTLFLAGAASAKPIAPTELCRVYPDSPSCAGTQPACTLCHTAPPVRNAFGSQLELGLAPGAPRPLSDSTFSLGLPEALHDVEALDADDDGFSNIEELLAGSEPGSLDSIPEYKVCTPAEVERAAEQGLNVCAYDDAYVFQRVNVDVCGRSATFDEVEAFRASADRRAALHAALDACLLSEHWLGADGVLWNLANEKVLPIASVKSGDGAGPIPLADYFDDYLLFIWASSGGRDVRDLLLADYFVAKDSKGKLSTFTLTPEEDIGSRGQGSAQFVPIERRAGMVTTRWFLMVNTMFTAIPRTTAAQAYRAYLGYDISRMEGLHTVSGEPKDFDQKNVGRPECAVCHATLDPLTYPFSRYEGIGGGKKSLDNPVGLPLGAKFFPYTYNATRLKRFTPVDGPNVVNTPEAGVLFGTPVADLVAWANLAANSDAFAQKVTRDYWKLLVGNLPDASDAAEFTALWQGLKTTHKYDVERLIHAIIDTEAYGVP